MPFMTLSGHSTFGMFCSVFAMPRARRIVDITQIRKHPFEMEWQNLETFSFGDSPDLANRLVELVLSGTKRATCWAESQGLLSAEVGKLMVVLDGQGVPKAVLKTIELTKRRFDEVDEAFAFDEGEGDRSLQYWREAHTRYFMRLGRYAPDMMLWCERFELVERIGSTPS
ncbi:ASCH domain-containing protein [Rhodopseudomonas sp. BR0C11]|uniref:ASCH domain-containing protein n=1 Tax=Rhodopseudomonas sp. BR0C11 TaxID=2269370 RepID=UPI0032DEE3C1